ncbi:MAG: TRAP transporter substrate-binding protein [Deltaproteobacteria bacterium]|nr:TRAP transporter substrate-binding protein [Deltaproteobacteria bacterium]
MLFLSLTGITQAAKPLSLDLGYALAEATPTGQAANHFAKVLKELSGGSIEVKTYHSSQLGSEREMQEGNQLGSLDMALGGVATLSNFDKSFSVFDMPFVFSSYESVYKTYDSEFGAKLLDGLQKQNIKGLAFIDPGFGVFLTKDKELRKPSDLKGLNIRCMEAIGYITSLKAFGANPVQSATSEVYTMLQNGTVDGTINPIGTIYSFSFYEHARYLSMLRTWPSTVVMTMSLKRWNSLTPEQQAWVTEATEQAKLHSRKVRQEMEDDWCARMQKAGLVVTQYTEAEQAEWQQFAEKNIYPQVVPSFIPQQLWDDFRASAK